MVRTGHIRPWWTNEHLDLTYVNTRFNNETDIARWEHEGFKLKDHVGGVCILQPGTILWCNMFFEIFKGMHTGVTAFQMSPGDIIPGHTDSYVFYKEKYKIDNIQLIKRAVVFLADWQSGHYLEVDRQPITNWKAGDFVMWSGDTYHLAANLGSTPRYTIQITFLDV